MVVVFLLSLLVVVVAAAVVVDFKGLKVNENENKLFTFVRGLHTPRSDMHPAY